MKEIIGDSTKLDAALEEAWKKLDPQNQGFTTYDALRENLKAQAKALGMPEREGTPEEKEQARKLADPDGTGKVTKENFKKLMYSGIEKMKAAGKI